MIQLVLRVTTSLALLVAVIYIRQFFPDNDFNNKLMFALLLIFIADYPIYGIQKASNRIDDGDTRTAIVILSIIFQAVLIFAGILLIASGYVNL